MLKIVVPAWEDWDPVQEKFIQGRETTLMLEHSLVSISKWESKYHKSFLNNRKPTAGETLDYIRFMTVSNSDKLNGDKVYDHLTERNLKDIQDYIGDPMTATTFSRRNQPKGGRNQIMTNELIYYYMTAYNIPFECQKWHLNRLMTLIEIAGIKNQPPKKMSRKDQANQYRSMNAARKAKHHSRG